MSEVYFSARPYVPAQKRQFLIHFRPSRLIAPGSRIVAVAGRSAGPPLIDSDPYGPRPDDSTPVAREPDRTRQRRPYGPSVLKGTTMTPSSLRCAMPAGVTTTSPTGVRSILAATRRRFSAAALT